MRTLMEFKLLEKLQTGLITEMYRAEDIKSKQKVILKILRVQCRTSKNIIKLRHEYYLLQTVNDSRIIRPIALIQEEQINPILVLQDVQGEFFNHYLNRTSLVDIESALIIAINLITIIGCLHQEKIIHRAIQPSSFMINPDTLEVKLVDLYNASQLEEDTANYFSQILIEENLAYISPEQTGRMNRPTDYRTDFYSLGITLYEILTGHPPFQFSDPLEFIYTHIAKMPIPVNEVNEQAPRMISNIINKLLAKTPEERYASANSLKYDLMNCLDQFRKNKKIEPFPLGKQDPHEHLYVSHKLYGRQNEIATLLNCIDSLHETKPPAIFINGYAGIGKTSLIQEVQKIILGKNYYSIYSCFTSSHQDSPL